MIIAISAMVLLSYIAQEVSKDSTIEFVVNSQNVNRVKAYAAARSGLDLSLLRVKIYQMVQSQVGEALGEQAKSLEMIWSFPFMWPPPLPHDLTLVDQNMIQDKVKKAKMDGSYSAAIVDEGSKIDLNDLGSPSKAIQEATLLSLKQAFENKMLADSKFDQQMKEDKYLEVINNIADWVDLNTESLNGGAEANRYDNPQWPPNRWFRTIDEVRLVAGMTDRIYEYLRPLITIYGSKGINPNRASAEILLSLHPSITPVVVAEIVKRRTSESLGGEFKKAEDFWQFVNQVGANVSNDDQKKILISFNPVTSFRIKSVGSFANATREIEVVVMDFNKMIDTVSESVKKEKDADKKDNAEQKPNNPIAGDKKEPAKASAPITPGRPRIFYWSER